MNTSIKNMQSKYLGKKASTTHFNKEDTAIIVVDVVKGFTTEGAFQSPRTTKTIGEITKLLSKMDKYPKVFFKDVHTEDSLEFKAYVKHCITNTSEVDLVDELKPFTNASNSVIIQKNNTNGFLAHGFQAWLKENPQIVNFIVIGFVTDICVSDFAKTLQCYFYEHNINKQVHIPANCVETYSYAEHEAELINTVSLYSMCLAGIKIYDEIK